MLTLTTTTKGYKIGFGYMVHFTAIRSYNHNCRLNCGHNTRIADAVQCFQNYMIYPMHLFTICQRSAHLKKTFIQTCRTDDSSHQRQHCIFFCTNLFLLPVLHQNKQGSELRLRQWHVTNCIGLP